MIFIGKRDRTLGTRKRSLERRFILGPNSVKVILVVLLVVFAGFYLSQSQSVAKDYMISDLQTQKNKSEALKAQLEVDGKRFRALSAIQEKAKEKGMEQSQ